MTDALDNLHSNMFLLIPVSAIPGQELKHRNLHSNMFLLILNLSFVLFQTSPDLHSNMFLLILHDHLEIYLRFIFTFQYVSINTNTVTVKVECYLYLHSNMFLLILDSVVWMKYSVIIYIPICFY